MLHVECPHCSKKLSAPAKYAGRQVSCKKCNGMFLLPSAEGSQDSNQQESQHQGFPQEQSRPSQHHRETNSQSPGNRQTGGIPENVVPTPEPLPDFAPAEPPVSNAATSRPAPPATAPPSVTPMNLPAPTSSSTPQPLTSPAFGTPATYPGQAPLPSPPMGAAPGALKDAGALALDGDSLIEARSWSALFDFRFKKFLSPKILRTLWFLYLLTIGAAFCAATMVMILGTFASIRAASGTILVSEHSEQTEKGTSLPALTPTAVQFDQQPDIFGGDLDFGQQPGMPGIPGLPSETVRTGGLIGFLITIAWYLLTLFLMFVGLCLTRVIFESLQVFYNIAGTLKSIESKLVARESL